MDAYCTRQGVAMDNIRFIHDGNRLRNDTTAGEAGLEDNDTIDALLEQVVFISMFIDVRVVCRVVLNVCNKCGVMNIVVLQSCSLSGLVWLNLSQLLAHFVSIFYLLVCKPH